MFYKRYRNKIADLFKITKEKNYRVLWSGVNEVIYSKKNNKTNSLSPISLESEAISDLQKRIFPTKKYFSNYLKDSNFDAFVRFSNNIRRDL